MEQVTFFTTRTLARAAVVEGSKFKDMGSNAPKGERWAVISTVEAVEAVETIAVNPELVDIPEAAAVIAPRPIMKAPSKPKGKVHGHGILLNGKKQKVQTIFKRNKTTVFLAAAIRGM